MEPEVMREKIKQAQQHGWQVVCYRCGHITCVFTYLCHQNVHVTGDRANHIVLNIFEDIQSKEPGFVAENRPRLEHAQIQTLSDLERTGRLGGEGF